MANKQEKKDNAFTRFRKNLLFSLCTAPEARSEEKKPPYPGGRFKRFFDTLKGNMTDMMTVNVLTIIFALPLMAVIMAFFIVGPERIGYALTGASTPYVMLDFGIGLSSGSSLSTVSADMLLGYRLLFVAIAVCLPILSFGIAGNTYICQKIIWGERFLTKKDKATGADVNRTFTEYFRGVKKYWKEMIIVFSCYAVFFAGGTELITEFVYGEYLGGANAGQWIGLFVGIIVLLASTMILFGMIPQVVSYNGTLNLGQKLRNACIYTVALFLSTFVIFVLACAPFALAFAGSFVALIVALFAVTIGFSYFCLMAVNYGDYNSENYCQEVLTIKNNEEIRQAKKEKKQNAKAKQNKGNKGRRR